MIALLYICMHFPHFSHDLAQIRREWTFLHMMKIGGLDYKLSRGEAMLDARVSQLHPGFCLSEANIKISLRCHKAIGCLAELIGQSSECVH